MIRRTLALCFALSLAACASRGPERPPIPVAAQVELARYMGVWYPIAHIPPWIEKDTYDSVEHYSLDAEGNVPTVFRYRKGSFDAPQKTLKSKGIVQPDSGNAVWGIRFLWPFEAEYLVAWLAPDYSQVIVARNKRDYVWYMARTPQVEDADYAQAVERIAAMGYDLSQLRKVPQRPEAERQD